MSGSITRFAVLAAAAAALFARPAVADEAERHFPDIPVAKLILVDTVTTRAAAVIEGPDGQAEIISLGDSIGREGLRVEKVGRGCLALASESGGAPTLLCVDEPSAPRS